MASDRVIASNRKAFHDYHVLETFEAGLALQGTEVKSLREGQISFKDAYVAIDREEPWLIGCHIAPYHHGSFDNHDPERRRKLLLHRREIKRLIGKVAERGLTLIPLKLYWKGGRAKLEVGLCRGKKLYDKRATIRERDERRELSREASAERRR
jgi:SsrA-binding protein